MKLVKFIKENKVIVFALAIVVLSLVLLALPGQYAHYGVGPIRDGKATYAFYLSGYQWMFGTVENVVGDKIGSAVPSVIAALVLLGLSFIGLLFSKKSSFVALLVSLALVVVAVLFFTTSPAGFKAYPNFLPAEDGDFTYMSWVPYVVASFTLIAGGLMMYRTVLVMRDEIKHPSQPKGPTYSYLHK